MRLELRQREAADHDGSWQRTADEKPTMSRTSGDDGTEVAATMAAAGKDECIVDLARQQRQLDWNREEIWKP